MRKPTSEKGFDQVSVRLNEYSEEAKEITIGQTERSILASYTNMISGRSYSDILLISDLYICEIETFEISTQEKQVTIDIIKFNRDLEVYINSWHADAQYHSEESKMENPYNCRFHPCVECCIIDTLEEIENSDLLTRIDFVVKSAIYVPLIGIECATSCYITGHEVDHTTILV